MILLVRHQGELDVEGGHNALGAVILGAVKGYNNFHSIWYSRKKYCEPHPNNHNVCIPCINDGKEHECGGLTWPNGKAIIAEEAKLLLRVKGLELWQGKSVFPNEYIHRFEI